MVDDKDNHVDEAFRKTSWEVPLLLLGAFRTLIDEAHERLAREGFENVRPVHGFTLQALGDGASATEVARRLGVSKQAAAKTLAALEAEGWVTSSVDPDDARRRLVAPTARGRALLDASVTAFEEIVAEWGRRVGHREIGRLRSTLLDLGVSGGVRLDLGSWSSS